MTHPGVPQRRRVDHGPFRAARAWWGRWGDLLTSAWLFVVTIGLLLVAVAFYRSQAEQERQAAVAAYESTVSCRRSLAFGPALARAYERFGVLNREQLEQYRASLPERCPPLPPRP